MMNLPYATRGIFDRLAGSAAWLWASGLVAGTVLAAPPTWIQEPEPRTVLVGQTVRFTAAAASDQAVQYQWRLNDADLPGQTQATLSLFCVAPAQSGQVYTVKATNADGSVTSGPATLQVQVPLGSAQPFSWGNDGSATYRQFAATAYRGLVGTEFEVTVLDTAMSGLWGTDIYTDDSSIGAAAVHAGLLTAGEKGTVRLKLTGPQASYASSTRHGITSNSYGSWPGSYQLLGRLPLITRQPTGQARQVGGTARFEVTASGAGSLHYQWHFNGNPVAGATSNSLEFPVTSTDQAGSYLCKVTEDGLGTVTSAYAVLGVLPAIPSGPQVPPFSVNGLAVGERASLAVTGKTSGGSLVGSGIYLLSSDLGRAAVHAGLLADGETGAVLVVRLPDQAFFRGETAHDIPSAGANSPGAAFAFLGRVPYVTRNPATRALLPGSSTTLTLEAAFPQAYAIQWRRNGVDLDGETGPTLSVASEAPGSTVTYDAVLAVPGASTVTEPALVTTVDPAGGHIYTVASPNQAAPYLSTPGNLVFVTVQGTASGGTIWGTDIYTVDSALGVLAVHAGLLSPGEVKQIGLYSLGRWPSFASATRNGITSQSYGAFPGMALLAPPPPAGPPDVTVPTAGSLLLKNVVGHVVQIWSSPSLLPGSWNPVETVHVTVSPQLWTDPTTPRPVTRFYRVVLP